jgi:hypothetical protein
MSRVISRRFLPIAIAGALALAACGDDAPSASGDTVPPVDGTATGTTPPATAVPGETVPDATSPDTNEPVTTVPITTVPITTVPGTTVPDVTNPDGGAIEHPVGADEVVLRIADEGGFVPAGTAFQNLPTLLVTGDGRMIVQGALPAIYPGPLLPNLQVRDVTEAGIQNLLDFAAEYGLLTENTYENPTNIADAPDTVVTIAANGEVYEHRAYALGLGGAGVDSGESDEFRRALANFVAAATDEFAAGELGAPEPYTSDTYLVWPMLMSDDVQWEIVPTIEAWPSDAPALVDRQCLEVPAEVVADLFAGATQLSMFTSDDQQFMLAVKPLIPGDSC